MQSIVEDIQRHGYVLVRNVIAAPEIEGLKELFAGTDIARSEREGQTFGARNLLGFAQIRRAATSPPLAAHLLSVLGKGFRTVRGIFFDKTESANWPVQWHQDLSLAVRQRKELPGWGNWSVKRGVLHVQPPAEILARMVTVRLHLDDCPATNGPLRVIAGSHRTGQLPRDVIQSLAASEAQTIVAGAGDALLMRPLILHASSPAETPTHRRVLHLEFAPYDLLPAGLEWAEV